MALRIGGAEQEANVRAVVDACTDANTRLQLASILARHRAFEFVSGKGMLACTSVRACVRACVRILRPPCTRAARVSTPLTHGADEFDTVVSNNHLPQLYAALAKDLDVVEAKTPEDIYKTSVTGDRERGGAGVQAESSRANLAASYVNAFVNAGFGNDKLVSSADSSWPRKNDGFGVVAAAASLGMVNLWDQQARDKLDRFVESSDELVRAGGILALGLTSVGTRDLDTDATLGLLSCYIEEGASSTWNDKVRPRATRRARQPRVCTLPILLHARTSLAHTSSIRARARAGTHARSCCAVLRHLRHRPCQGGLSPGGGARCTHALYHQHRNGCLLRAGSRGVPRPRFHICGLC
ncbi:hypothetical protein EON67_10005 [archaeon]|nr:MAG: hypothetical protein EON67_10005 [archaeon]